MEAVKGLGVVFTRAIWGVAYDWLKEVSVMHKAWWNGVMQHAWHVDALINRN